MLMGYHLARKAQPQVQLQHAATMFAKIGVVANVPFLWHVYLWQACLA